MSAIKNTFGALTLALGLSMPAFAGGFDQTLALQGVSFHVMCPNQGSINVLRIEPQGLKKGNAVISKEIEGTITGAEVADLNADGSPEIYVYVASAGSGSYGSLVAYAANRKKSLTEIYLPSLEDNPKAMKGYMGHDELGVVERYLVRRFPVYRDQDIASQPTGGMRQIQYILNPSKYGWTLKVDKVLWE